MLPGIVREVHQGKKGYGNYVLLEYGNLQCLYGHLSRITVKQDERSLKPARSLVFPEVQGSQQVHICISELKETGKSVDPEPFIAYLNHYITNVT
jgi:murein DD-endopeptidase MepM/ murein hydrolase activator NlpD